MTILHLATSERHSDALHAAAIGDDIAVCGDGLTEVLDRDWESAPQGQVCPRCQHAVEVLRLISAV